MISAAGVLKWGLVGLYDESMLLLKANVCWFLLSLPLGLPLVLIFAGVLPPVAHEDGSPDWLLPSMIAGLLLLLLPNPASLGLCRLAVTMTRRESPPLGQFWQATRENLRLGLLMFAIGLIGVLLLVFNLGFYLTMQGSPLQAVGLLWLYLLLFWLAMQLYLAPLVLLLDERRPVRLYRRAALLALAHPLYSLTFLLFMALLILLCVVAWPVFPLLAMSLTALIGTRALDVLRRRYDPQPEPDQEIP